MKQTRRQLAFRTTIFRASGSISKKYNAPLLPLFLTIGGLATSVPQAVVARASLAVSEGLAVHFAPAPPGLETWAERARAAAPRWLARIRARFSHASAARIVVVDFSTKGSFVARTSGDRVLLSTAYLLKNPDDIGVLAHEMTHVVQGYPNPLPGWLTEGIADYVRYYGIEPNSPRARFDLSRDSFIRGYQPAAFLLRAVERQYGCKAIDRLNSAMRSGSDIDAVWMELTGVSPAQSWHDLVESPDARDRVGRPDPSPCFRHSERAE